MLSKTIRNAAASGERDSYFEVEINEFDLETWAHEARKLEAVALEAERIANESHLAADSYAYDLMRTVLRPLVGDMEKSVQSALEES